MPSKLSIAKRIGIGFFLVFLTGFLIPERLMVPVDGASISDWNRDTFWFEPWGASGVHKGIDIFAKQGEDVLAATGGIVVYSGSSKLGGNVVLTLGPKWRFHYYAHMESSIKSFGSFVSRGEPIGSVGTSGNAVGKQPHLHYVILTAIPYPWLADTNSQGWKKMFYLDPNTRLLAAPRL
jgi:murein DD-endopeptidase MepM/ murein hydrolase activator NlpD